MFNLVRSLTRGGVAGLCGFATAPVVLPGETIKDGVARHSNNAGAGQNRVLFLLELEPELKPDR